MKMSPSEPVSGDGPHAVPLLKQRGCAAANFHPSLEARPRHGSLIEITLAPE